LTGLIDARSFVSQGFLRTPFLSLSEIVLCHFGYDVSDHNDDAFLEGWNVGLFVIFLPACLGRLWLFLYLISGLILKLSRKLDVGFNWFNSLTEI
jgi:hypothetical protein